MTRNNKRTVLYLLATLALVSNCYGEENIKQAGEPDYSETQWRTFYGEKPADYRPEYWVTYYGSEENEECYKPNVVSVVDGKSRIRKKIYKEFIAEEKDDGKGYIIRYPNRFKIGNCMYSSGGGQLYIEEKSDDPRLNQEPYKSKKQIYRQSIIRNTEVMSVSLASNNELDELNKGKLYSNKSEINIFCYRINKNSFDSKLLLKYANCFSSSIENKVNKILMYNSYIIYTINFWKSNPDIKINFRVSNKVYCNNDQYCQKSELSKVSEDLKNPEVFSKLYFKGDD
ncbi:hypothetical protein BKG95_07395 [Rodentibacter pneumotropicus]|uniref:Lipoprotein n=1 Tax=Rodentibacter pneumotropicus TaxID=758 RepID=A0AAW5LEA3_9PAST|nr:hypothetical protein [Rodentibacter pneumotropicus]MCQ9122400.1 hypothetical protein [Rodentibacter pneumotropicus]OOF67541.1 hypothetical protein BKG95_07395 [Rodentibacter pneumotropicus]